MKEDDLKSGDQTGGSFICGGCGAVFAPGEREKEWDSPKNRRVSQFNGMGCPRCGWFLITQRMGDGIRSLWGPPAWVKETPG